VKFLETALPGVLIVEPEPIEDERGFFARTWCRRELADHGLCPDLEQCSISFNRQRGTLRGLHYQAAPHGESKLVRVTRGAVYDVALDLRPGSPSHLQWCAVTLTAENRRALYIPEGVAHGFLTLCDEAEVFYQISRTHAPEAARGVRWNDPAFAIAWPEPVTVISARDRDYPDFQR